MATQAEDWAKQRREIESLNRATKQVNKSMGSYTQGLADSIKLAGQLRDSQRKVNVLIQKRNILLKKGAKVGDKELDDLNDKIGFLESENKKYSKAIDLQKKSLKLHRAIGNTLAKTGKTMLGKGWQFVKALPGYYDEQDKAVRQAALSMGNLSKESAGMFENMSKTAVITTKIGVNTKALAKLQMDYSQKMGKTMLLNTKGLESMAEMQQGAFMGDAGMVAEYASHLESFGVSAEGAKVMLEDGANIAQKMGVNVGKFTEEFTKNMKLADGYNFKGGLKDIQRMTTEAIKFKMTLESVAGVADQLINPEGAVEMAAKLQVLGGNWAKLADPFTLMFQSRHDMEGLHKSLIEATKGAAQWNKEAGEFEISGMEMHRLREVAKATGMDYKELSKAAKATAKDMVIKGQLDPGLSKDAKEFIGSNGIFNNDSKKWEIDIVDPDGKQRTVDINKMTQGMAKSAMGEAKLLKERAEASQTFGDEFNNLIEGLKTTFLPFIKGVEEVLKPIFDQFTGAIQAKDGPLYDLSEKMRGWGKDFGNWIVGLKDTFADIKENFGDWIVTALVGFGLFKMGQWVLNGLALARGFKMGTGGGFGGGGGGGGNSHAPAGAKGNKSFRGYVKNPDSVTGWSKGKNGRFLSSKRPGVMNRAGHSLKNSPLNSRMGAGVGLGALGMGANYMGSQYEDQESAGAQAWGTAGSMANYAAMGMMVGGPWGAAAGAAFGLGKGVYDAHQIRKKNQNAGSADPNMAYVHDAIIPPGGPVLALPSGEMVAGDKSDSVIFADQTKAKNKGGNSGVTDIKMTHTPVVVSGTIKIEGAGITKELLNNESFIRDLALKINSASEKMTSGGGTTKGGGN